MLSVIDMTLICTSDSLLRKRLQLVIILIMFYLKEGGMLDT